VEQTNNSESGQTLVEYGLIVALVALIPLTFVPVTIAYQYMRRVRHTDRKTAFLVAIGFTMLIGMLESAIQQGVKAGVEAAVKKNSCCESCATCCPSEDDKPVDGSSI
jgi:hypothetical protein